MIQVCIHFLLNTVVSEKLLTRQYVILVIYDRHHCHIGSQMYALTEGLKGG